MNAATILVVDDETQIRRVMRSTLSSQGYVIREATTGEEAVEERRQQEPADRQHREVGREPLPQIGEPGEVPAVTA